MKILFYNLGYARGIDGSPLMYRRIGGRIIHQSVESQKRVLDAVAELVVKESPDLFTFVELAKGRWRNSKFDQVAYLESQLLWEQGTSACEEKYHSKLLRRLPFHSGNVNGYIASAPVTAAGTSMVSAGNKRLVYQIQVGAVTVYVVHLSLRREVRARQLRDIAVRVQSTPGDVVVCGDFNLFEGIGELDELITHTKLRPAGNDEPTFPAFNPKLQLDAFLYRFSHVGEPQFRVIRALHSDHLPIVLEW